jgi:hypothetical protein
VTIPGLADLATKSSKGSRAPAKSNSGWLTKLFGGSKKGSSSSPTSSPTLGSKKEQKREKTADSITWKAATPNVIHVGLSNLESSVSLVTGDPIYCNGTSFPLPLLLSLLHFLGCNVVMSKMSKLEAVGEGEYNWTCEFCKQTNKGISVDSGEVPKSDIVDCIFFSFFSLFVFCLFLFNKKILPPFVS